MTSLSAFDPLCHAPTRAIGISRRATASLPAHCGFLIAGICDSRRCSTVGDRPDSPASLSTRSRSVTPHVREPLLERRLTQQLDGHVRLAINRIAGPHNDAMTLPAKGGDLAFRFVAVHDRNERRGRHRQSP